MARLVAVTVKEKNDRVHPTALAAAIPGKAILYVEDRTTDSFIKAINRTSPSVDEYLVDENFATMTTNLNAANSTNGLNAIDVNVSKIDDKDHSAAPLDRLLQVDNILYMEDDPDNPGYSTLVDVWDPQRVRLERWVVDSAIADLITAANA